MFIDQNKPFKISRRKSNEILILSLCILVGFVLRFYTFDKKSLWMDEIHTFNDSRDDIRDQLKFYKENPTYLHPPLFFILTHQFYPFKNPERELRIFPLIFGTLSIPMIYILSRSFSPNIALPLTISLTFMAYHISLSQDGRCYALLMFLGMASLYFFIRHLKTLKKKYLFSVAFLFSLLFLTSYSSVPFIALSQILWFYRTKENDTKPALSSFFLLNGLTFLFCLPWILFVVLNYHGQPIMDPNHTEDPGSFWYIIYGIFHDWVPHAPLIVSSVILLILFPFFSKLKKNAITLLAVFILPVTGLYFFCKLLNITHFVTSRYFINFLPIFLISLFLSIDVIENHLGKLNKYLRMKFLFMILFLASNMVILPLYYHSEKQDFRGLVNYLRSHVQKGDKIFVEAGSYVPGILHYFGMPPERRHYIVFSWKDSEGNIMGLDKSFNYRDIMLTIYRSKTCCTQYVADGSRLWIIISKYGARKIKGSSPCILKGYFDGSFLNFNKFPADASMYLFLWDPLSSDEKGIDMPIE